VDSHGRGRAQAEEHDLASTYRIDVNTRSKHIRRCDEHRNHAKVFDGRRRRSERESPVCLLDGDSGADNTVKHGLRQLHRSKQDTQVKVLAANQGILDIESHGAQKERQDQDREDSCAKKHKDHCTQGGIGKSADGVGIPIRDAAHKWWHEKRRHERPHEKAVQRHWKYGAKLE